MISNILVKVKRNMFLMFNRFFFSLPVYQIRAWFLRQFVKKMGKNVYVGRNVKIYHPSGISIGDNVVINEGVLLDGRQELYIGNNVDIAREASIWTLQHDYNDDYHKTIGGMVCVKDYCWICFRAIILPNVILESGAVIAAGALVNKNVPSFKVYGGIPAHEISCRKSNVKYKLIYKPHFYE